MVGQLVPPLTQVAWKGVQPVSSEASRAVRGDVVELPSGLPSGARLVTMGRERGERIEVTPSAFSVARGVRSEAQLKAKRAKAGELTWSMIMGRATVDEQVDDLRYLHKRGSESGFVIDRGMVIPDWTSGLPPELRADAPKGTSFLLSGEGDHKRIAQAAPISPAFCDWHIGSPYCVENTAAAIAVGASSHGVLAQFTWDLPLVKDDVAGIVENVTAIGMVAARRDEWLFVDSYMDDGMPNRFVDNASLVGYAMLEKYVVDDLCGARYATGFGGLISDIPTKVGVWLALHEVLKAEHPGVSYLYGNTISPSETETEQNYGVIGPEMAVFAAVETRMRTGVSLLPTPITEKVEVPPPQAIFEARMVAGKAAERGAELGRLLDWPAIERLRDTLVQHGREFFANAIELLKVNGVNVGDPLQVLLALRRIGAHRLELLCHPRLAGDPTGEIVPYVPTELLTMAQEMADAELATIKAKGLEGSLKGKRFLVASADTHWYGAYTAMTVLRALGANVVDAGSECGAEELADAARRQSIENIAVSAHNGQCLTYGTRLAELLEVAELSCSIYVGGKLNAILDGDTEPSDMCERLREAGLVPCRAVLDLVEHSVKAGPLATS